MNGLVLREVLEGGLYVEDADVLRRFRCEFDEATDRSVLGSESPRPRLPRLLRGEQHHPVRALERV